MNTIPNYMIRQEQLDVSDYEDNKERKGINAGSTKYSNMTRSKFLIDQQDESVSYSDTFNVNSTTWKRKQQNRESAKKCRMRKKQRQFELNQKEKELQLELLRLREEHTKVKYELEKYSSSFSATNIFNKQGKTEVYDRLQKIVQSEDIIDEDQINLILDSLKNKQGATGTERQGKIAYIFKQIIHICFPALHRYLMWTANNNSQYFGQGVNDGTWLDISYDILNLSQQQQQVFKSKKEIFQNSYSIFSNLINQMKSTKRKLENESQKLQDLIQQLRHILTPVQCAKFVTFIENNKYKSEMALWDKRNIRKFSDQVAPALDPGCKKKPRIDNI